MDDLLEKAIAFGYDWVRVRGGRYYHWNELFEKRRFWSTWQRENAHLFAGAKKLQ